ncbi:hypothetical protein YYG_02599 [Plasmodium vinckei petteri]|uniref:Gametocyte-specific protein n=1 Tax=Plasmodium vinckei petteri TaxID=138298 RepID=W7AJE2_PLAVN|nr:hypothetical protein YYG_02599 [Plasmodium vinckei petteri]CAD2102589.1 conserved rodent malaria protein, unknown function [Plasmodium vinckei petteri]
MVANVLVSSLLVCFFFVFLLINNNVLALSNLDGNHKNGENIYSINSENNQFSYVKTNRTQLQTSNFIVAVDQIKGLSDNTNIISAVKSFLAKSPTLSIIILLILSVVIGFITHKATLNILKKKICCDTSSNDDITDAIKDNIINESIERTASETKENEINEAKGDKINELNEANKAE